MVMSEGERVRRMRTTAVAAALLLAVTGCGAAETSGAPDGTGTGTGPADGTTEAAGTAEPDDGEASGTGEAEEDAGDDAAPGPEAMPKECGQRWVEPEEPIPGPVFAECLVTATSIARTAHYVKTDDQGQTVTGVVATVDPFQAHFTYSVGPDLEMILHADAAWITSPQGGWIQADPGGTPEQQMAHGITASAQALASHVAHEAFLASSPEWTPVDDEAEDADGVWAYSGTPQVPYGSLDRYVVWIDNDYLPIRIERTETVQGVTVSVVEQFSDWGGTIEIPRPE